MRWKISNNAPRSVIGDNSEIHTLSRHASWLQCNLSICYRIRIFCPYPLLLSEPTLSTRPQISKVRRAADGKLLMRAAPTNSDTQAIRVRAICPVNRGWTHVSRSVAHRLSQDFLHT